MPVAEMQKKIEANSDSYEPTRLKTNITPEMLTKLEEKKNELPGVMIEIQPVRNYLYKELAVHAIGYVGEVSNYDITEGSYKNMPVERGWQVWAGKNLRPLCARPGRQL